MFETAELGIKLGREEYEQRVRSVRARLLELEFQLRSADFATLVLLSGLDGAGRGEFLNVLHEWMDTRYLQTEAYSTPTEEQRQRPEYWRFWMWLPPKGRTGVFVGSWYTRPLFEHVRGKMDDAELASELSRINAFERALSDSGTLVLKLWFHVSKKEQEKRFKRLERSKETSWRVTKRDWRHHRHYDEFVRTSDRLIRTTSTGHAPWFVVEGTNYRHRNIEAGERIATQLEARLKHPGPAQPEPPELATEDPTTILDSLDLSLRLPKDVYNKQLAQLQAKLHRYSRHLKKRQRGLILVFEGQDAAGKGGAIRRITGALDARHYRVIPIAAPTDEESSHHYLWRFWRHLPRLGRITIYDRSWYGRVLVERVEGLASRAEWRRAYKEINDFEEQLVEANIVLIKFWLHIDLKEQLRRFKERESNPYKMYKITPEDYRNREKAYEYEAAASEMIERTSTGYAPWVLVEANDKRFARVKVLKTICRRLKVATT